MIPRKIGETPERSLMSKTKEPVDHAGPLLPPRTWSPNSSSRNQMNVKVETLTIVNKNLLTVQNKKSTMSPDVMVDLCQVLTTTLLITDFLKPRTTSTLAKKGGFRRDTTPRFDIPLHSWYSINYDSEG